MVTYVVPFPCDLTDDFGRTNEDTVLFLNVLANDQGTGLRLQKVGGGTAAIGDVIARIQTTFGLVELKLGANNQVVFDPGDMFDSLRLGQSTTFQGVYRVTDVAGTSESANITIRVDGLNDGPQFSVLKGRATFIEAINASAQNLPAVQGSLVVNDADIGNTLDAKIVGTPTLTYSAGNGQLPAGNNLSALTSLSALKLTDGVSNGGTRSLAWTYDPTAVNLDFLRPGEILTIRYGVAVSDGRAQAATQNLVFTIRGTNDAPIIKSADPAFDVTGALTETNAALSTSGRVVFADLDRADTPAATVTTSAAVVTATGITLTAAQINAFKAGFAITNPGTGAWSYNLPASATQFMDVGDQVKIVYSVKVTDDFGAFKTQPVTITINGTNDGLIPGPVPAQQSFTEALDAPAQNLPATTRTFLVTDPDVGDTLTANVVGTPTLTYSAGALPPGTNLAALTALNAMTLGSAISNGGQRSIPATYNPIAVNLDFLSVGETLTIRYGIAITDGTVTAPTQLFTIKISHQRRPDGRRLAGDGIHRGCECERAGLEPGRHGELQRPRRQRRGRHLGDLQQQHRLFGRRAAARPCRGADDGNLHRERDQRGGARHDAVELRRQQRQPGLPGSRTIHPVLFHGHGDGQPGCDGNRHGHHQDQRHRRRGYHQWHWPAGRRRDG